MDSDTSIGPAEPKPTDTAPGAAESVDAQDANAFDMRHGLAGAEAKPFANPDAAAHPAPVSAVQRKPPADDESPHGDTASERPDPGSHGGASSPDRRP